MADDSLQKTLAHLQSAARAAGRTINPKHLADEEREAVIDALASRSREHVATVQQHGQVGCPAAPSAVPPAPPTQPDDGMVYLVDTWPHRAAIKASRQAGYSAERRRWYLLDPARYDQIPPQCLPPGMPRQAGAGGGSPQEPTADQAHAGVSPPDETPRPQAPVLQSPVPQPPPTTTILALPWWPAGGRAVPNPIVRSALFGVVRRGRREFLEQVQLPAIGGTDIRYTGARLDQADLDVWMGILEIFKGQDIALRRGRATVGAREFLRSIGRSGGGNDIAWLERTLARLQATALQIRSNGQMYSGSLVVEHARDERTGQLMVEINPRLVELFQAHEWTRINWDERQGLGQDHLAKWLHGFYSSHQAPYAIKMQALREWSGSSAEEMWKFRQQLREAMGRVAAETGWHWELDREDRLHVIRPKMLPGTAG